MRRSTARTFLLFVLCSCACLAALADVPEYTSIRGARPDGRVIAVQNLQLVRDVHNLSFRSGSFHLLAPAGNGRTFGAIFIGDGTYELRPQVESERRHLGFVSGDRSLEVLSDTFDHLILLFGDGTFEEISASGKLNAGSPDAKAVKIYDDYLKQQKTKLQVNLHLRVLRDHLNGAPANKGVFLARVDGKKRAPALIAVDPTGFGNLAAGLSLFGGEESVLLSLDEENGGLWYLGATGSKEFVARGKALTLGVDALHYQIETRIASNSAIEGTTTIRVRPLTSGIRVLPLNILPKLRVSEASYTIDGGASSPAGIVQEEVQLGRFKRLFKDEIADADAAVVFASALPEGKTVEVRLRYKGTDVLRGMSPDSYSVGARESWYPNVGTFVDPATYEMTFRFPKKMNLISTGKLVSEKEEGGEKVTVWKSDIPIRVAGFNYGRFDKISKNDPDSGVAIDVYSNRDFSKMAQDTMADAVNSARVGKAFFGDAPYSPVSVTQQVEWSFGQSWPALVYLPSLAMITSTERAFMLEEMGPAAFEVQEFAKMVGWHEFAHQWWGHQVGWQSYRDQWLSEGLAEFTSALVLQFTENVKSYDNYWERRRREILSKQGTVVSADVGPISNGLRLSTRYSPGAYSTLVYSKGAFVIHMLRKMMEDTQNPNPDHLFMAMMHEFTKTYSGKNPSTADFQKIVERHMTPAMNASQNGKMDWFFNQWIYGTEIPKLSANIAADKQADGKYRIHGTLTQAGVSNDFRSVVPLYVDFGKDSFGKLGQIVMVGNSSTPIDVQIGLPKPPRKVVINAMHDVLARE